MLVKLSAHACKAEHSCKAELVKLSMLVNLVKLSMLEHACKAERAFSMDVLGRGVATGFRFSS